MFCMFGVLTPNYTLEHICGLQTDSVQIETSIDTNRAGIRISFSRADVSVTNVSKVQFVADLVANSWSITFL